MHPLASAILIYLLLFQPSVGMDEFTYKEEALQRSNDQINPGAVLMQELGIQLSQSDLLDLEDISAEKLSLISYNFNLSLSLFDVQCGTDFGSYRDKFTSHIDLLKKTLDYNGTKINQQSFRIERVIYIKCVNKSIEKHFEIIHKHLDKLFVAQLDSTTLRDQWERSQENFIAAIDCFYQYVGRSTANMINESFNKVFHDQITIFLGKSLDSLTQIYEHRNALNKALTCWSVRGGLPVTRQTFDKFVNRIQVTIVPSILTDDEMGEIVDPYLDTFNEIDKKGQASITAPLSTVVGSIATPFSLIGSSITSLVNKRLGWNYFTYYSDEMLEEDEF